MHSRIKMRAILCAMLVAMTCAIASQTKPRAERVKELQERYGIEPGTKYDGSLILEALAIQEEAYEAESEARIKDAAGKAYDEGYKQASIDASEHIRAVEEELEKEKRRVTFWDVLWPILAALGGFGIGKAIP